MKYKSYLFWLLLKAQLRLSRFRFHKMKTKRQNSSLRFKTSRKQYEQKKQQQQHRTIHLFRSIEGNQNGDSSTEQAQMKTITRN